MTGPAGLPTALAAAADRLDEVRGRLERLDRPDLRSLEAAAGRIGDVGRRLRAQADGAWRDRADELRACSAELVRLGEVVEGALRRYSEIDDESRHGIGKSYQGDS
jgi:hypothetical protein